MTETSGSWLSRVLREPLVHFLALGAVLFAGIAFANHLKRPVVRIDAQEIEQLATYWELQSQRPPTRAELSALIQERVDEELLAREAIRLGLDRDDMIVRRRLAQKMAFASEDIAAIPEPDEKTLQAYYDAHRDRYATPGRVAMRHLFFSRDRTGATPQAAAAEALTRLEAGGTAPSDPSLLPLTYADVAEADLDRDYGPQFAAAVHGAAEGAWIGPVPSAYGLHLVRVERRLPPVIPPLAQVRDDVRAAWLAERRQEENGAFRASLRKRYKVEIAGLPE
ncbi:peptidylprolyl isomerase [Phenylobacterium sp.]|uniref:peptidylprolyl isomerase n=1 Tax=Phenylobacterium sp. TaxID=1871053 RepID=UPI0025ECC763|nr:peptidylprolyl isomerase [Phenylobacterium sp.]MBX3485485.1 peptidyl-prolyl cis-trans isomerase [Phenylobacterium sp.]MCW5759086.1 peptidyl-prolyl cis-trans isomerase [Phenylobacterium sp.]